MSLQQRTIRKKPILNWLFDPTLKKNKYPQDYADFRMIKETKQGLEDVLRHNDTMRSNQEIKEYLQRQE